uniref:SOGA coiled-coil domain-containing protein n=1 Tax=Branchiostoma floridae TaxID=7739 RepID=C3ZSJ8_BRAFL|eukprot:XP_002588389.1 hypothetical protein BRAFLDRAFT_63341 [Branchiostoma floridae]
MGDSSERRAACGRYDPQPWRKDRCRVCFRTREDHGLLGDDVDGGLMPVELAGTPEGGPAAEIAGREQIPSPHQQLPPFLENRGVENDPSGGMLLSPEGSSVGDPEEDQASTDLETSSAEENGSTERIDRQMKKDTDAPPPRVKPRSGAHSSKPWRQNSASTRKKLRTADEVMVKPGDVTKKLSKGGHIGKPSTVRGNFERGGGLSLTSTYTRSSLTKSPAVYRKENGARTLNTDTAGKGTTGIWSSGGKQQSWHTTGSVKAKPDGKPAGDGIYLTERYRAKARAQASRGTRGSDEKLNNYLRSPDSDRGPSTSPDGGRRSPSSPEDRNAKVGDDIAEENSRLKAEIKELKLELEEMQDSFREEEFEQFRQLQRELEQTSRNCRILQLRLRKAEKRNEQVEADRGNYSRVREIEQDLKVAKDVSVRLHHELEQVEEKRSRVEEQNQHLRHKLVKSETSRQALKGEVEKLRKQIQKAKNHNKGSDTEDASSAAIQATSAEAQSDVRRQLELVEEETNLMRQSLVEVEKDRDGLQFQLEQYKRKYGEFESSESEQAEQSECSNISKEAQLKLKLKLVEEEATTLGRKLIEMEVKNEKIGAELQKYRGRCKNMSASSSESEASYPESDMPENVEELRRQLQFLEEEADVLRRTVSDLEEQNQNLMAQVSRYQAEKKAGNLRPRGKDGGQDLKARLRLLEEDNSILKQKLAAMEYDNRILVSTIQKYELEIKCAKSAKTPDSGSKEDINKKQLEEEVTFLRNKLADMEGRNEDLARICEDNEHDMAAARMEKDMEKQISEFQRLEEMCLLEQNIEELQTHLEYLQTCLDQKDEVCKRQEKELTVMAEELRILKTEAGLIKEGEEVRWRKQPTRDDTASAMTPPSDEKKKGKSSKVGSPTQKSTRSKALKDMIAQDKTKTNLPDNSEDCNCETNGDSGIVEQHGGRSRLIMTSSETTSSPLELAAVVNADLKQVPLSGEKLQMLQESLSKVEETRKLLLDCSAQTSDLKDKNGSLADDLPDWSAIVRTADELQHHCDRLHKVCTEYRALCEETQEQKNEKDDHHGQAETVLQSLYHHCALISTNSSSLRQHMASIETMLSQSNISDTNDAQRPSETHPETIKEQQNLLQMYSRTYVSLQNLVRAIEEMADCFVQPAADRDRIPFRESTNFQECSENSKLMVPTKASETEPKQDTSGMDPHRNDVPEAPDPPLQNDDKEVLVGSKGCFCHNREECSQTFAVAVQNTTNSIKDSDINVRESEHQTDTVAADGAFENVDGSSSESQHLETISLSNSAAEEEVEGLAHSFITPSVEVYPCEHLDLVHLFAENLKLQDELEVREIEWTVQNFQLSYELDRLRELCTTIAQLAFSDTLTPGTIPYEKEVQGSASLIEETLQEGRMADAEMKKILETLMTQVSDDLDTNKDKNCKTSSDVASAKDELRGETSGKVVQAQKYRRTRQIFTDWSSEMRHMFVRVIWPRIAAEIVIVVLRYSITNYRRRGFKVDESRGLLSEFRGLLEDLRTQLKNEEKRKKDIHDLYMAEKSAWDNEKQRLEERIKVVETKSTQPQQEQKQNKMADLGDPDMERCQSAPPGDPYVYRTELVRKWEEEKKNLMHMFAEERNQWQEQLSSMQSKIHEVTDKLGIDARLYIGDFDGKDTFENNDDPVATLGKSKAIIAQSNTGSGRTSPRPNKLRETLNLMQREEEETVLAKPEPSLLMMPVERLRKSRLLDKLRPQKGELSPYNASKFEKKLSLWRRSLAPKEIPQKAMSLAKEVQNNKDVTASQRTEVGGDANVENDDYLQGTSPAPESPPYTKRKSRAVNVPDYTYVTASQREKVDSDDNTNNDDFLQEKSPEIPPNEKVKARIVNVLDPINVTASQREEIGSDADTKKDDYLQGKSPATPHYGKVKPMVLNLTDDESDDAFTPVNVFNIVQQFETSSAPTYGGLHDFRPRSRLSSTESFSGTDDENLESRTCYRQEPVELRGKEKREKRKARLKIKPIEIESDFEKDLDEKENDTCTSPFQKESKMMKWPSVEDIREVFQGRADDVTHEEKYTSKFDETAIKNKERISEPEKKLEPKMSRKAVSWNVSTTGNDGDKDGDVIPWKVNPLLHNKIKKESTSEDEVPSYVINDHVDKVDGGCRSDDDDPRKVCGHPETDDYKEAKLSESRKKHLIKMFEHTRRVEGMELEHLGVSSVGYGWQFHDSPPDGTTNVQQVQSELVQQAHYEVSQPLKGIEPSQPTEQRTGEDLETGQPEAPPTDTCWQAKPPEFQALRPFSPVFDDPVPKRKQLDSSGLTQAQKHNANTEEILRWEIEKRQLKRTLDEALRQIASVTDDLQTYKVSTIGTLKRSKSQSDLKSLQDLDSAMETLYHTSGASSGSGYTASYSNRHPDVTSAETLCSSSNKNRGYYRYATEVPYRGRANDIGAPTVPPRSTTFRMMADGEVKAQKPVDRKPKKYSKRSHTMPIPDRREVNGKLNGDDLMHPSQFKALKQLFEARTQSHGLKPMNFMNGATGPYVVVPKRSVGYGKEEEHPKGRLPLRKFEQIRGDAPSPVPILPGSSIVPVGAVPVLGIPVRGLSKLVREKEAMKAQAERDERNARSEIGMKDSVSLDSPRDSTDRSTTSEETSATQELLDEILLRRSEDQRTPSPASDRSSPKLVAQNVRVVSPERGPPSSEPFVPKSASSGPYENVASWLGQSTRIQNVSLANHDSPLHSETPLKQLPSAADPYSRHSPSLIDTYGSSDIASRRQLPQDTQSYLHMDRSKSVDSHLSRGRRGADDFAARLLESRTKTERIEEAPVRRPERLVKSPTFPDERMMERSKSAPPTRHLDFRLDEPARLTSKPPRPVYTERIRSPSPPGTPSRLTPDPERSMSPVSPNMSRRRLAGEISSDSIRFPDGGTLATRKLAAAEERYREGHRLARAAETEDAGAAASASFGRDTYPARSRQEQMRYQMNRETGIPALDRRLASMRQLLHTEDLEDILTPSYQRYKSNEQHMSSYRREEQSGAYRREEHHSVEHRPSSSVNASSSRSRQEKQPKKKPESTASATSRVRNSSEMAADSPELRRVEDFRKAAERTLPGPAWWYYSLGDGDNQTLRDNCESFKR